MGMYSAFFDDSGHPDEGDRLTVAGGVASVEQWAHFEREWKAALRPLGTEIFHAVDFDQRKQPFDQLDENGRCRLYDLLVGIICRRVFKTIACTVKLDEVRNLNAKYLFSESFGFPYPTCARSCMGSTEEWAKKNEVVPDHIEHVFEDGAKHKGQILWIAERDNLSTPIFKKKTEAIPLQVGDLLGWLQQMLLSEPGHVWPPYLSAITRFDDMPHSWVTLNLHDTDGVAAFFDVPQRDPKKRYKCKIVRADGKRMALIHCWGTNEKEPKIYRKSVIKVPDGATVKVAAPHVAPMAIPIPDRS